MERQISKGFYNGSILERVQPSLVDRQVVRDLACLVVGLGFRLVVRLGDSLVVRLGASLVVRLVVSLVFRLDISLSNFLPKQ